MRRKLLATAMTALWLMSASGPVAQAQAKQNKPALQGRSADTDRSEKHQHMLANAVRHELATLPYYDVFDWLEAELVPGGGVVLRGQVVRPTTATDAVNRVRSLESVTEVTNEIKVLPLSRNDDDLRVSLYRAIYNWSSPLFRYAMRAMPPIHIIVENGRATLKGAVAQQLESQLAYTYASQVPGIFEVRNELRVDE